MPKSTSPYPKESPLSTPAVEEYCLLKYSDRYVYKTKTMKAKIDGELLKRFKSAKPSNLELSVFSEFFNRRFDNPSEIKFAEDEDNEDKLYGYLYKENGHKKLISVFYINNFKRKDRDSPQTAV
ncbi:MAG: hypothetical protein KKE23_03440 [Nanoarchaeota archaeon]|nr:hypothetical protein [Nanoarchaeota archaeon]